MFALQLRNRTQIHSDMENDMDSVIEFIWTSFKKQGCYFPLKQTEDILLGIRLNIDAETADRDCQDILNSINSLIDMKITLKEIRVYANIWEMAEAWPYNWNEAGMDISLPKLRERQQLVITHMLKNDSLQAQNHYCAYINGLNSDLSYLRNAALDFLAGIVERLRNDNRLTENNYTFPYISLSDVSSVETLLKKGAILVGELTERVTKLRSNDKKHIINKACVLFAQDTVT